MKNTYVMLAFIATLIITWLASGGIHYMVSTISFYKESLTSSPVLYFMLIIGWVPAVIVGADLDRYLS